MIKECRLAEIDQLRAISIKTFSETFKEQNSNDNLTAYLEEAYNLEKLQKELLERESSFYFIFDSECLAGYLKINWNDAQTEIMGLKMLEIERIYILSAFKRKGLGQKLINKAIQLAKTKKKEAVWLGVWENNQSALKFYEKNGFKVVGAHSFWLGDDEQTDFIMQKQLL